MNDITIHIDRLGAIKDSEIRLNKLMIFSGESGLGKSYVAALCHYFFYLLLDTHRLSSFFEQ